MENLSPKPNESADKPNNFFNLRMLRALLSVQSERWEEDSETLKSTIEEARAALGVTTENTHMNASREAESLIKQIEEKIGFALTERERE